MKVTKKTIGAIRVLKELSKLDLKTRINSKDLSKKTGITVYFLEQILRSLVNSGLVDSRKGPKGGYTLAVDSEFIDLNSAFKACGESYITGLRTLDNALCNIIQLTSIDDVTV